MADWAGLCVATSLLVVLLTAAGYALYSGLLSDITVLTGSPPIKKITFVYKFKKGPYESCGELFKESRGIGPKLSRIGVYYDDPKKVPGPQCRSAVGSILSEGEDQADEELLRSYETSGFKVFSFPEVTHVVTASFPHRTFFSVLLGMRRVYPRLEDHIKARRLCAHPFLEIYREGLIQFMAPLARQGDFYVPEIRQAERRLLEREDFHSDSEGSGADSNSECSSGSGVLLLDSRETSPAASSARDDEPDRGFGGRSSGGASFQEPDRERQQQAGREERPHGDWDEKGPAPHQWLGAVVGEE
uniref:Testis expressed 264, ER-phagy receptor n=1 Tax=Gasterosteus aculeatus aculeatus TaxID=481459 RepID=A0AAQ4QVK9_GASAC|nr:testis-expressed protein 264 [Gasterosteus aculeatus aculeatus]XP_040060470.1 testis-expressed protein 264 [Gasterosteus aculeatus aculeatus]